MDFWSFGSLDLGIRYTDQKPHGILNDFIRVHF